VPHTSDPSDPAEYRRAVELGLHHARDAAQSHSATVDDLTRLAQSYLDAGDDLTPIHHSAVTPMTKA
jgi:hypothetical protein